MDSVRVDEEKLREAACYGDLEAVSILIKKGVNINSQHNINGWTPLHWAAKRNHLDIAHFLLTNGADINAESFSKEKPADLTTSPAILNLLGSPTTKKEVCEESEPSTFTPHYLSLPNTAHKVNLNDQAPKSTFQAANREGSKTEREFHELVLKLRLAYSTDIDFIEAELNKCELTYASLLNLCCTELGLNCKYVERLRKLPNTWLRKDKDVQRLKDFEEIEVVLVGSKPKLSIEPAEPLNIVGPAIKNQTIFY